MAAPALNGVPAWMRELAPQPGRLDFALKLALICTLTVLVAEIYGTPEIALTAYVVFFVNKPDRMSSLLQCVALTVVITLVILLLFGLAQLVVNQPAWRVAAMTLLSLGALFLASASKLRPVAGTLALVVAYALDLLGSIPAGELATRGLLYAWLFIAIPAAVSVVINLLVGAGPRRQVQRKLAERLRAAHEALERRTATPPLAQALRAGNAELLGGLRLAALERNAPPEDLAALRAAVESSTELLAAIHLSLCTPQAALPQAAHDALLPVLADMAAAFEAGGYPVDIQVEFPSSMADEGSPAAVVLSSISKVLAGFSTPRATPPAGAHAGFWVADAFTNPDHLRYAIKTTAAAMLCYLLYSLLSWPGIHTSMLTCYIVSLGTLAESAEKLRLRIAGCLVGAAIGLSSMIWLVPELDSISALLILVFVGALLAAWVAAGSVRIAYAGFQIAFAFFLCVLQGSGPGFDMVVARDRVIGILLGIAVAHIVQTRVWPVSVKQRIVDQMSKVTQSLRLIAVQASAELSAQEARLLLHGIREDLVIARLEPLAFRPDDAWIARQVQIADRAESLAAVLGLAATPSGVPLAAARLRELDDAMASPSHDPGETVHASTQATTAAAN